MRLDDRFDDLVAALGGFYRAWLIYLGIELGLLRHVREAGRTGVTASQLAAASGTDPRATEVWLWAADAHRLVDVADGRATLDEDTAAILLDVQRPEYLGGQFVHSVVATLDWDRMADFFRSGQRLSSRPDRYRSAIERLTEQDIAVFFQEALALMPDLVVALSGGGRVLDVHCGGGRWLVAMAGRFAGLELVGVEAEADSVARARRNVADAGLGGRVRIELGSPQDLAAHGKFDLVYYQYALHTLDDPAASLASAWRALRPGGRILVLDWPVPTDPDEIRTIHGELIAGIHLDEVYMGTGLATAAEILGWCRAAGLPAPEVVELPSGATLFQVIQAT
jgi:SAM-dependent methyltransferase